jgi:aspartate/methionine/tyrosine aminotransferase
MRDMSDNVRADINLMDTWLVENDHLVRFNLGESNVDDLRLGDVLAATSDVKALLGLTLGNNSTWGSDRLRQAVAATYPGFAATNVLATAGVSEAVVLSCLAHRTPGANFVIPTPAFHALIDVPRELGYEVRTIPLRPDAGFALDADAVIAAIDGRTRIVLLNSPHNPTGRVYDHEAVVRIANAAHAVGAVVIADEHYRYLPHAGDAAWLRSAADAHNNVVSFGSVGKCFGCTGLRVGWIVAHERLLAAYHQHKLLITHTIPLISDSIAATLLERRQAILPRIRQRILANLERLGQAARRSGGAMVLYPPDAGSVAFLELPGVPDTLTFAQTLLEATGVLVLPGESFDLPGFLRIRLGLPCEDFSAACDALEDFLARTSDSPATAGADIA